MPNATKRRDAAGGNEERMASEMTESITGRQNIGRDAPSFRETGSRDDNPGSWIEARKFAESGEIDAEAHSCGEQ